MAETGSVAGEYLDAAFDKMLQVAVRCGRHLDERPLGPHTNSVAALILHCCAVCEFWLGHVALGRPSDRDRDGEFRRTAGLVALEVAVADARSAMAADLDALAAGRGRPSEIRAFLPRGGSDESVVLHVFEELYQHLGHMELTVDALAAGGALDEPLYHLAISGDWERARAPHGDAGAQYQVSTIGRTLQEEGFIHCSFAHQLAGTARRFHSGRDDVVVLQIDPARLEDAVRVEDLTGTGEGFPHLYGPLPVDAVVAVLPLRFEGGDPVLPPRR